jgi:hypothetical protein
MCHCVGQRTNIPTSRPGGVWSSQWIQAGLVFNAENSNASYPRCRSHRARLKLPDDLPPPLMALPSLQPPSLFIDSSSILLGEYPPFPSQVCLLFVKSRPSARASFFPSYSSEYPLPPARLRRCRQIPLCPGSTGSPFVILIAPQPFYHVGFAVRGSLHGQPDHL